MIIDQLLGVASGVIVAVLWLGFLSVFAKDFFNSEETPANRGWAFTLFMIILLLGIFIIAKISLQDVWRELKTYLDLIVKYLHILSL